MFVAHAWVDGSEKMGDDPDAVAPVVLHHGTHQFTNEETTTKGESNGVLPVSGLDGG